jgi:hypothetical protein
MPLVSLNPADVANAQLGINLPVLLGYVRGQGNEILNHALSNKARVVIRIMGEGEIDGIERLFINSKQANHADTNVVHFHPGTDGVLGVGLTPVSTGRPPGAVSGNQIINGDGETGVVGSQAPSWTLLFGNNLLVANDFAHSGNNSLKINNATAANSASYQEFPVVDGGTYRLQAWIKTSAITTTAGSGAVLNVDIVSGVTGFTIVSKSGSDFAPTQPDVGIFSDGNAHNFTLVSCVFKVTGTGTIRLYCQLGYTSSIAGQAWFDDVTLTLAEQEVDSFWSLLPANFQPTTFSRKSYLMLNVPPDPAAPSATLTMMADLRGLRMRQFDGSGNQTGYAFSTNGAEQCLELILRTMIKPEWNPSAAAAAGGDLVAAEKARINWASLADSVSWCNTLLANGQKRFESSLAIVQQTSLLDALTQLCVMSQLYITDAAGQIYICPDKPRSSTFILKSDHIVAGTAEFDKINLHGANNRFIASYNDLNAQGMADIDIPGNNGLLRSGTGIVTVQTKTNHPFTTVGQGLQIVPPQDGSAHDSAFDGVFPVVGFPAANKFTYAQSGNANWLLWSEDFGNGAWVMANASVVTNNQVDPLGGNTADTITSAATGIAWGFNQTCAIVSSPGVPVTMSMWLRAASNISFVLQMRRGAFDTENVTVTVTTVWQRFSFTHSGSWTGSSSIIFEPGFLTPSTAVFVWGAQIEDGSVATTYRQTTSATNGVSSGNGTVGTPESRFAVRSTVVDHEQHQNAIGQRGLGLTPIFRVSPITLNMGNNTEERVRRVLNFMRARKLGIPTTPYLAPWTGKVTCFMDAVDLSQAGNPRALISQLCGDIITVDASVTEEYQGDYEIKKAVYTLPGTDGGSSGSGSQSEQATIQLELLQYLSGAFSDTSLVAQAIRASIPSALVPIAAVDSNGVQRLAGTFRNNPVNSNGIFTGANPLSQSGVSTTILVASFVLQFGGGQVSYNSGSVNPGGYGKYAVYVIDPKFTGGAVVYLATQSMHIKTSDDGIIVVGTITTSAGGGGVGSGGGSGAGDGTGGSDILPTR